MASELEEGGYFPSGSGLGETSHPPAPDGGPPPGSTPSNSAHMIAREHCYSKLGPLRDSPLVTALPTVVLFPDRIRGGQSSETRWLGADCVVCLELASAQVGRIALGVGWGSGPRLGHMTSAVAPQMCRSSDLISYWLVSPRIAGRPELGRTSMDMEHRIM